jgi:hypothetical protein
MKSKQFLIVVLALGLLLALVVGLGQAQGPSPGDTETGPDGPDNEIQAVASVAGRIPIQGRLTDAAGNPLSGTYLMTFRLYASDTGGTELCEDTNTVTVEDGLFVSEIWGSCGADGVIDGKPLFLGIQLGSDPEMTPRQPIYPVPYASSLRPGAVISDTQDGILTVRTTGSGDSDALIAQAAGSGEAIEAYAEGGVGIFAKSDTYVALQAYSYDTGSHPAIYGCSAPSSGTCDPLRDDGPVGVMGYSSSWYAGYFYSEQQGLRVSSGDGFYAAYFVNRGGTSEPGLRVDGYSRFEGYVTFSGGKTGYVVDVCLNEGPETLETGDVVVVTGFGQPVIGSIPLMTVRKAAEAQSTGVVGIVDVPFVLDADPENEGEPLVRPAPGPARVATGTGIGPGSYLSVVTLGAYETLKVDASYGAIQPGDLLVSSPNAGYAMKATDPGPGTVLGKALGALPEGTGVIPVLVTLQ